MFYACMDAHLFLYWTRDMTNVERRIANMRERFLENGGSNGIGLNNFVSFGLSIMKLEPHDEVCLLSPVCVLPWLWSAHTKFIIFIITIVY